jgi:hypothetical protein
VRGGDHNAAEITCTVRRGRQSRHWALVALIYVRVAPHCLQHSPVASNGRRCLLSLESGTAKYLDALLAAPFPPFAFSEVRVSAYQFGNFGTAAKLFHPFERASQCTGTGSGCTDRRIRPLAPFWRQILPAIAAVRRATVPPLNRNTKVRVSQLLKRCSAIPTLIIYFMKIGWGSMDNELSWQNATKGHAPFTVVLRQ